MNNTIERNLGEQPITQLMKDNGLSSKDLVEVSTEQLTHKMIARACKGRRLTPNTKSKVRNALNKATDKNYSMNELYTY